MCSCGNSVVAGSLPPPPSSAAWVHWCGGACCLGQSNGRRLSCRHPRRVPWDRGLHPLRDHFGRALPPAMGQVRFAEGTRRPGSPRPACTLKTSLTCNTHQQCAPSVGGVEEGAGQPSWDGRGDGMKAKQTRCGRSAPNQQIVVQTFERGWQPKLCKQDHVFVTKDGGLVWVYPPSPTNALSNGHFHLYRVVGGPNYFGTGFRRRMNWVPNGVPNEHSWPDRIFRGFRCSLHCTCAPPHPVRTCWTPLLNRGCLPEPPSTLPQVDKTSRQPFLILFHPSYQRTLHSVHFAVAQSFRRLFFC